MNKTELIMRRKNVRAFIKADAVTLELTRPNPPIKTEAGGYIASGATALPSQEMRIILNKRRFTPGIVNSEAGDIPHTDYLIVAEHSRDIKAEDTFDWLGEHYKVVGVYGARTESILAAIDLLGTKNRNG